MRLLISERPQRRHLRMSGDASVFGHHLRRLFCRYNKDVDRQAGFRIIRGELPFRAGEIERAERLMNEHRPSRGADQPLNGNAPAVSTKMVATLPAAHRIDVAPSIELRPAFSHSQYGATAKRKGYGAGLFIDSQLLHGPASAVRNLDLQWIVLNRDARTSDALAGCGLPELGFENRTIIASGIGGFRNTNANSVRTDRRD